MYFGSALAVMDRLSGNRLDVIDRNKRFISAWIEAGSEKQLVTIRLKWKEKRELPLSRIIYEWVDEKEKHTEWLVMKEKISVQYDQKSEMLTAEIPSIEAVVQQMKSICDMHSLEKI